jgi:hypothetical protein
VVCGALRLRKRQACTLLKNWTVRCTTSTEAGSCPLRRHHRFHPYPHCRRSRSVWMCLSMIFCRKTTPPTGGGGARDSNIACSALAGLPAASRSVARDRRRRYRRTPGPSRDRQAALARFQGHEDHAGLDVSISQITHPAGTWST